MMGETTTGVAQCNECLKDRGRPVLWIGMSPGEPCLYCGAPLSPFEEDWETGEPGGESVRELGFDGGTDGKDYFPVSRRTKRDIDALIEQLMEWMSERQATKFPSQYYEDGVLNAVKWLFDPG